MKQYLVTPFATKELTSTGMRVLDEPWAYGLQNHLWELSTGHSLTGGNYIKSTWAYACMQIRGTEIANLPWRIVDNSGDVIENHQLIEMITEFGPESNYYESMSSTEIDLCMTGAGYWLRDVDILKRLNPNTMKVIADSRGNLRFEQYDGSKKINDFKRDEIIYFREYHPDTDLLPGIPVMEVLKRSIAQELSSSKYVESFFKNGGVPALLLTSEQTISQPEMEKTVNWFKKTFSGTNNVAKTGMVDKGLKAEILSLNMEQMSLVKIRDQLRIDICTGFRVPKILVGMMEEASYANAQEARRFMIEDLIIPRANYIQSVINEDLIKKVDPNVKFEFVPNELPILMEDVNSKWSRIKEAVDLGIISSEFARTEMGYPEDSAPDEIETTETDEVDNEERVLRAWYRKSKKAFGKNESPNVDFYTDVIPADRQIAIRSKLNKADSIEDIQEAIYEL